MSWIRHNKLATILLLIIGLYLIINLNQYFFGVTTISDSQGIARPFASKSAGIGFMAPSAMESSYYEYDANIAPTPNGYTPTTNDNRMVIQDSSLAIVVSDVNTAKDQVINIASRVGGYMVNSNLTRPEESPYAIISIRVPADQLQSVLEQYKALGLKVTSETLNGRDVTDQYADLDTRLTQLRRTMTKFEALHEQAEDFDDLLRATREIQNLQSQIDSLIGQQQYLEQNAKLAKITVHLSTDELALPYAPTDSYRPLVVFKQAVRSLNLTLRSLLNLGIWLGVYAVIWIPAIIIFIIIKRWRKK